MGGGAQKESCAVVNVISDTRLTALNVQHVVSFKLLLLLFTGGHSRSSGPASG